MKEKFDIYELPQGHEERFLQKLSRKTSKTSKKIIMRRILYWSASVAALFALFLNIVARQTDSLQRISETAYQSEQYYLPIIEENIKIIKSANNEKMMQDAMSRLNNMNENYLSIRNEIIKNGQNKQLINAMIVNFDTQIEFSNNVIAMMQ